jgi:hypothetical protein
MINKIIDSIIVKTQLHGMLIFLSTIAVFSYGCAPAILPHEELDRARGQHRIHAVHYPPRLAFSVFTKEGSKGESIGKYFGPVGLIAGAMSDLRAAQTIGESLLREYGIEDPVLLVKVKVTDALARQANFNNIRPVSVAIPNENPVDLKQTLDSGMVIDFKTITWMMQYTAQDPSQYTIAYRAHSRLVRLDDGKVLWEGECSNRPQGLKTASTLEELTANQGSLLKARLQEEADFCADNLFARLEGRETKP